MVGDPFVHFVADDLEPWQTVAVLQWNALPHFLDIGRWMERVTVHEFPTKFVGEESAYSGFAGAGGPRDEHDHMHCRQGRLEWFDTCRWDFYILLRTAIHSKLFY